MRYEDEQANRRCADPWRGPNKSDAGNTAVLEALRDLIDRVELGPNDANGEPAIILTGALASMVRLGMGQAAAKLADRDLFLMFGKVGCGGTI